MKSVSWAPLAQVVISREVVDVVIKDIVAMNQTERKGLMLGYGTMMS